jgi:hypothetical protein
MIFDHFVDDSYYFLVVERISGRTLSEVFNESHGQLIEDEVVRWGIAICDVVAYIHKEGIVHRDISPDNIMLTDEGSIKFIDFGTLREFRYIASSGTAGMGKYGYSPPEQWQGRPEPRSDIFALGATIYYLLTGFLPLSHAYLIGQPPQKDDFYPAFPPIREKKPNISPRLETILQKALQLDIDNRYSTPVEMRQALEDLAQVLRRSSRNKSEKSQPNETKRARSEIPDKRSAERPPKIRINGLSDTSIRWKTASDALQHPFTILPLAFCLLSLSYVSLLSPILGGGLLVSLLTLASGIACIWSFRTQYVKEYLRKTRELAERVEEERTALEKAELERVIETIQTGFSSITCTEGLKVFTALIGEYEQLQPALERKRATDPLSLSLVTVLATETYRRGLSVLSDALELMLVIHTPGRGKFQKEIDELEQEIESLKKDKASLGRLRLKEETLATERERIEMLDKLQLNADQLFHEARRCEVSLQYTRIEVVALRTGGSKTSVDSVVEALQTTIQQVKEVQNELNRLGI